MGGDPMYQGCAIEQGVTEAGGELLLPHKQP